jgi:hypothetical protein
MGALRFGTGIALAALLAGCGSTTSGGSATSRAPTQAASRSAVPNPFRIVARYSASSLGLKNPRDLAIGPNGNLYITDASDRVTEMSATGKVLRRWGGPGKRPGEFKFVSNDSRDPNAVAASIAVGPSGHLYVSDSGNNRVEVFSPTGRFIRQFGSSITQESGHFVLPSDLVVDSKGNVYVSDAAQNVVEKYSPTGAFLWQVGSGAGSTDPELSGLFHLQSIDRHGLIVIANDTVPGAAVIYLDPSGHKIDGLQTTADLPRGVGPCDVSLDSHGDAFVQACPGPSSVGEPSSPPVQDALVFDHAHKLIGAWHHAPFLRSPTFGPDGEVFALGGPDCIRCTTNALLRLKVTLR